MADKQKDKDSFKISELEHIKNIDNNDLLLVSDKEGGKYYTKSMTIEQLIAKVVSSISSSSAIMNQLKQQASQTAEAVASDITADRVQTIIKENPSITLDLLDGNPDGQLIMGDSD